MYRTIIDPTRFVIPNYSYIVVFLDRLCLPIYYYHHSLQSYLLSYKVTYYYYYFYNVILQCYCIIILVYVQYAKVMHKNKIDALDILSPV